jgi:hypothetical protein
VNDKQSGLSDNAVVERLAAELAKVEPTIRGRLVEKFMLAALGSIPWVGGFLSAAATFKTEESGIRQNTLQTEWLREHEKKLFTLKDALEAIYARFENLGDTINERIQSEEYLKLVRKAFRVWDEAEQTARAQEYVPTMLLDYSLTGWLFITNHISW